MALLHVLTAGSNGASSVSDSQWLSQLPTAVLADAAPEDVAVTAEEGGSEAAAAPVAAVLVELPASIVDVSCYQAMGVLKEVPAGDKEKPCTTYARHSVSTPLGLWFSPILVEVPASPICACQPCYGRESFIAPVLSVIFACQPWYGCVPLKQGCCHSFVPASLGMVVCLESKGACTHLCLSAWVWLCALITSN